MTITAQLKAIIKSENLNPYQLAKQMGINNPGFYTWINSGENITDKKAQAIIKAVNEIRGTDYVIKIEDLNKWKNEEVITLTG